MTKKKMKLLVKRIEFATVVLAALGAGAELLEKAAELINVVMALF